MPSKTPRIVASIVISLASLLLFFGWAISYPESVTGVVTITAQMPPVRLIAPTSGKLHLLKHKNGSTINGGEIWNEQMSNTTEDLWTVTSISTDTVWAGGANRTLIQTFDGGNMWVPSLITGINNEIAPLNPEKLILEQNYPNPFNSQTVINYQVPSGLHQVSLKIYNITGKEVITLVNKQLCSGSYQTVWNGVNAEGEKVTSNVYFYYLRVGRLTKGKKMIVIR